MRAGMFHRGEVESGAGKDPGTENGNKLQNCFHRYDSSTSRQQLAKFWARKLGETPRAKTKHPGALLSVYFVMSTGWYTPRTLRARRSSRAKISCGIPGNFCAGVWRSRQCGARRVCLCRDSSARYADYHASG